MALRQSAARLDAGSVLGSVGQAGLLLAHAPSATCHACKCRLAADAAAAAPRELTQEIVRLKGGAAAQKEATLLALCSKSFREGRTIIFAKTKQRAHRWAGLPMQACWHGARQGGVPAWCRCSPGTAAPSVARGLRVRPGMLGRACLHACNRRLPSPHLLGRRLKMLFGLAGLPPTGELHGDMTQAARLESLERFRKVGRTLFPVPPPQAHCLLCVFACQGQQRFSHAERALQQRRIIGPEVAGGAAVFVRQVPDAGGALPWCKASMLQTVHSCCGVWLPTLVNLGRPLTPALCYHSAVPAGRGGLPVGHGRGCPRPGHPGGGDSHQL